MTITNPTAFDRKFFRVYNALCFIGLACELVGCGITALTQTTLF